MRRLANTKRRTDMKPRQITVLCGGALAAILVTTCLFTNSSRVQAGSYGEDHESMVEVGLKIAPVPLNLTHKDRELVGLGSYLVNAVASCNDCHSAGTQTQYLPGGNPYFGQPAMTNPATYLGGGRDFGTLIPVPGAPDIVSRNLTPDKTGLPEGGRPFIEFLQIMKTGVDLDHLHPACSATVTTNCLTPPFDGNLLQIMPWPTFQHLTDYDIRAIYEYLSAIPCVEGPPAPSPLHNDCY
jgi:cytochrome c553